MLELTFWVGLVVIAFFCWFNYVIETSPYAEDIGMADECVMCNEGSCKGCPVRISLSKAQEQQ